MVNDTIGDMITRLRNGNLIKANEVFIPKTKMTVLIAEILRQEGFIQSVQEVDNKLSLGLKYKGKKSIPYITRLTRISKPGLRVYTNKNEIPRVLGGIGIAIISTSEGIMTDRQARAKKLGGEILCYVW
jgi:small subunit ribosomal protein S8